mgnify:CR=1 FL=1
MTSQLDIHTLNLIKMIHLQYLVDDWCRDHPAYHAAKAPRTDCPKCKEMWQHRLRLNQINDIIETELDKNPTDVLD